MIGVLFLVNHVEGAVPQQSAEWDTPEGLFEQHEGMLVTPVPGREVGHILEQLLGKQRVHAGEVAVLAERTT
jgi:hypothetical protein